MADCCEHGRNLLVLQKVESFLTGWGNCRHWWTVRWIHFVTFCGADFNIVGVCRETDWTCTLYCMLRNILV